MISNTRKITSIIFIIVLISAQVYANSDKEVKEFSLKLKQLRQLTSNYVANSTLLIALLTDDPRYKNNLELCFLISEASEINSLLNVFILQLNNFDPRLEKRIGKKSMAIPDKKENYCCWKSISIIYCQLSYQIQEILKEDILNNFDISTPHILYQFKESTSKVKKCLVYFSQYFAEYG